MEARRTALLLSIFLLVGCQWTALPEEGNVEVVFSIHGDNTRVNGTDGEWAVDNWALLLFMDDRLVETGTSNSGSDIRITLVAGNYSAFAVVNPPAHFDPEDYSDLRSLMREESDLQDNTPDRLVMTGSRTVTVSIPEGRTQWIGVDRLVCKAGIEKISVEFTDPLLATRPFVLKGIYLTNCYGKSCYSEDLDSSDILSSASYWHNRMGFHPDSNVDALLADPDLDVAITVDRPYVQEHAFYFYPNPLPETLDSRSETWTPRMTRLVIEAEIGGRTYYYAVTLPASQRNKTYVIEEAVIRKLGSKDPELEEPGSIDVVFRTDTDDWSPKYNVTENS